jgi:hypothetical protein
MSTQGMGVAVIALLPFAMLAAGLWLVQIVRERRAAAIARQIALTDAIHREVGAAAAPVVTWSWRRGWLVSVRLPLHAEGTVGVVTRLADDLFRRLDPQDPPRMRLLLMPEELGPRARRPRSERTIGPLRRVA